MLIDVLSVDASQLLRALVIGLIQGSIFAVGAIGLTLSYGVTKFINFAYGEFLTYGAFLAVFIVSFGTGVPIAGLIAIIGIAALGVGISKLFFEPIEDEGPFPLLITSVGVAFILRYSLAILAPETGYRFPIPALRSWEIMGIYLSPIKIVIMIVAILAMLGTHAVLQYTMLGKKMRAYSGNKELSMISGIDTEAVIQRTWLLSAGIGGLAGILLALFSPPFGINMGFNFLLTIFAATILGGIGKPYGAMVGALIIGLALSFGTLFISPNYTQEYGFIILVVVLLIKPDGIMGGEM